MGLLKSVSYHIMLKQRKSYSMVGNLKLNLQKYNQNMILTLEQTISYALLWLLLVPPVWLI